jgi:hypothetical protein
VDLADLGLSRYPFPIVPPTGPTQVWAGRPKFQEALRNLSAELRFRDDSSIDLVWADLGAGKTHAMRYLSWLLSEVGALCIYSELPATPQNFMAIYRELVLAVPEQGLAEAIRAYRQRQAGRDWLAGPLLAGDRDTATVLWTLAQFADHEQGQVARRWLRGEKLTRKECSLIDGVQAMRSDQDALRALTTMMRLLTELPERRRVVLMLDEFQRIGTVSRQRGLAISAAIKSLYDSCPNRLSIFLSYSFGDASSIRFLTSPDVLSRVNRQYRLDHLTKFEATRFVSELLRAAASGNASHGEVFAQAAIVDVVSRLDLDCHGAITPRRLSQAFGNILSEALRMGERAFPIGVGFVAEHYGPPVGDEM